MKDGNYQVSFKIILKDKKGRILILKMPPKSTMAGYYDFPGGRIKQNEYDIPLEKIIEREMKEELGSEIKYDLILRPVAVARHTFFSKTLKKRRYLFWIFFEAVYKGGRVQISDEHVDYKWVRLTPYNIKRYFIKGPLEGIKNYLLFKKTRCEK